MKKFEDLVFETEDEVNVLDSIICGIFSEYTNRPKKRARLNFENGYGISVITGGYSFTSNENEYEIAVLKDNSLCYSTPITDDVIGYLTKEQVTEYMKKIQELEN